MDVPATVTQFFARQVILRAGEATMLDDLAPADLEFGHDWFRVEQMFARA